MCVSVIQRTLPQRVYAEDRKQKRSTCCEPSAVVVVVVVAVCAGVCCLLRVTRRHTSGASSERSSKCKKVNIDKKVSKKHERSVLATSQPTCAGYFPTKHALATSQTCDGYFPTNQGEEPG